MSFFDSRLSWQTASLTRTLPDGGLAGDAAGQMSFNMHYLQLQNQMQNENRQFTMVSNIMKTKHDTVTNTIANIR